jgi:hypothetical protein
MRAIHGTDNNYFATKDGRIYSKKTNRYLKFNKINSGYYTVMMRVKGRSIRKLVHRLVAATYLSNPKPTVNHKNGIKTDNRLKNLEYMTYKQNQNHADKTGLRKFILSNHKTEVIHLYKNGMPINRIANKFNCSSPTVFAVVEKHFSKDFIAKQFAKNRKAAGLARRGRRMPYEIRAKTSKGKVKVFKDGKEIGVFLTAGIAAESLNANYIQMLGHLRGLYKTFKGYTAEYVR